MSLTLTMALAMCPNFAGDWYCQLSINNERVEIHSYEKISQTTDANNVVSYDMGGFTLRATRDHELTQGELTTLCLSDSQLRVTWNETGHFPSPMIRTITRVSETELRNETVRVKPVFGGNNVQTYECRRR